MWVRIRAQADIQLGCVLHRQHDGDGWHSLPGGLPIAGQDLRRLTRLVLEKEACPFAHRWVVTGDWQRDLWSLGQHRGQRDQPIGPPLIAQQCWPKLTDRPVRLVYRYSSSLVPVPFFPTTTPQNPLRGVGNDESTGSRRPLDTVNGWCYCDVTGSGRTPPR